MNVPQLQVRFCNDAGKTTAIVARLRGHQFLFSIHEKTGEVRIWPYSVGYAGSTWENPAWDRLEDLVLDGLVEQVYEGLSAAPDDRYVWRGCPVPELEG